MSPTDISIIPFNHPARAGQEEEFIRQVLEKGELTSGHYVKRCQEWLSDFLNTPHVHLTPSCTHALEIAALLLDIQPGDEIIMPSFTFVSAATAFVLRGAVPVFVDIRPDTMNIDERLIEQAITPRTRAIMVMHYGGVACDMDAVDAIARKHNLPVIEDAAHALMAKWKGRPLGTLGTFGVFSFHQTKNLTAGEGGALIFSDERYAARASLLQNKGTNRLEFFSGKTNVYTWMDVGSSWNMNELAAAYLYGNMQMASDILARRKAIWDFYKASLAPLEAQGHLSLPVVPAGSEHNAHIFHVKLRDGRERADFIAAMAAQKIHAVFHYVPLHSSPAGLRYGRFTGEDTFTTRESERLVRLPIFYNMTQEQASRVADAVQRYYAKR